MWDNWCARFYHIFLKQNYKDPIKKKSPFTVVQTFGAIKHNVATLWNMNLVPWNKHKHYMYY